MSLAHTAARRLSCASVMSGTHDTASYTRKSNPCASPEQPAVRWAVGRGVTGIISQHEVSSKQSQFRDEEKERKKRVYCSHVPSRARLMTMPSTFSADGKTPSGAMAELGK